MLYAVAWGAVLGSLGASMRLALVEWLARREAERLMSTLPTNTVEVWQGEGVPF